MSSATAFTSIALWDYRDTDEPGRPAPEAVLPSKEEELATASPGFTEEQVAARIQAALVEARHAWNEQAQLQQQQRDVQVAATLADFAAKRQSYFKQLEQEVVALAIAIARKITEREASLDPALLQALVRIALDRMGRETPARVRLAPAEAARWRTQAQTPIHENVFEIVEDAGLAPGDCTVETALGSANFGFEAQLKEVEQSFADLLARRPGLHGL